MSLLFKERIKTIFIFILIAAGLLQVGILWGYQSQGTPTSSILSFFLKGTEQVSDTVTRERLFVPDRLILSDGEKSHWILGERSEFYEELWNEAKQGLIGIARGTVNLKECNEEWISVIEKRGFLIEFGYEMDPALLKWFLGVNEKTQDLPLVYKLMINPDIVDENTSTIYLYSTGGKVYVSDIINFDRERSLRDLIASVSGNEAYTYRNYYTFRGGVIDKLMGAEPDVLYVLGSPKYWPYFEYSSKPPAKGEEKDEVSGVVLGNEKDRYDISRDNEGTFQFNYGNNVYRYYADGYLTYQYLGSTDSSRKSEVGEALWNAYKFVDGISNLSDTDADIVLTSVAERQQGGFSFTFDYRLMGMPVKVEIDRKDINVSKLTHAIEIQADSKNVLRCEWILRDLVQGKKGSYNDRFTDLDLVRYTGLTSDEMHIQDMRSGYYINSTESVALKPMLLIDMKDNTEFQIEMPSEKGD